MKIISFLAVVLSYFVSISAFASKVKNTTTDAEYDTLNEAVNQASGVCTLELLDDVEIIEQIKLTATKTITIDAKGHNVTTTLNKLGSSAPETSSYFSPSVFFVSTKDSYRPCIIFKDTGNSNGVKGAYNGLSFVALSETSLSEPYVQIKIESGNYVNCSIYSVDYKSKVVIEGGNFTGGNIITRSLENSSSCMADIEINGGEYDGVNFILRPQYRAACDTLHINAGEFEGCTIRAENSGISAKLIIGDVEEDSNLNFENCILESYISAGYDYAPEIQIKRGYFLTCEFKVYEEAQKVCSNPLKISIKGGVFENCTMSAFVGKSASGVSYYGVPTISIEGNSKFIGGRIYLKATADSANQKPQLNISGGEFDEVLIDARESNTSQGVAINITGGAYRYCALYITGASPSATIKRAEFVGCFIGARSEFGYGASQIINITDSRALGCCLRVQNYPVTSGSKTNEKYTNLGYPKITFADYSVGMISERLVCEPTESTVKDPSTQADRAKIIISGSQYKVAQFNGNMYDTLPKAFDAVSSSQSVEALIKIVQDSYTPAIMTYGSPDYFVDRQNEKLKIVAGRKVIIEGESAENDGTILNKTIDSNFEIGGILVFKGGYYTGNLEILEGGVVYATPGTRFKNNPGDGLKFTKPAELVVNNGEYLVKETPGFSVRIR